MATPEISIVLAQMQADVRTLKEQDVKQTNMIEGVCKKIDTLQYWIMGVLAGVSLSLLTCLFTLLYQ